MLNIDFVINFLRPDEDKEKIGPTVPKPPSMPAPKPPPPPPASKAPPLPGSAPKSAGAIPPKQLMSQPMSKPIPPPPSQPPRSTPVPMPPQPPPMMVMGQGPMGPPQQMGGPMMGREFKKKTSVVFQYIGVRKRKIFKYFDIITQNISIFAQVKHTCVCSIDSHLL